MKKLLSILFAIMIVATLCLSVSAASGINDAEKAVLDKLKTTEELGTKGAKFFIPTEYINAAENYFLTIDMTDAQKDTIIGYLDQAIATIKAEAASYDSTATYQLKNMSEAGRRSVLKNGQDACAAVGATLVYNPSTNKVVITNAEGTTVFENTPLVKSTGEAFNMTTAIAGTVIAVAVLGSTAVLFVTAKKNGLLVK